jgi:hypothetical protein
MLNDVVEEVAKRKIYWITTYETPINKKLVSM